MQQRSTDDGGLVSSVDSAVGSVISWVSGKKSVEHGRGPTDGALGALLSWVVGRPAGRR